MGKLQANETTSGKELHLKKIQVKHHTQYNTRPYVYRKQ